MIYDWLKQTAETLKVMNYRAFSKIWLVIILILLTTGGILAWRYWKGPEEKVGPSEEIVKDETADWKIYQNEKYKYEVKYPQEWDIENVSPEIVSFSDKEAEFLIMIGVPAEEFSSIDEYYNRWEENYDEDVKEGKLSISKEEIKVGTEKGYKITVTNLKERGIFKEGSILSVIVVLFKEKKIFEIIQLTPDSLEIFELMVSTFRFLE